MDVKTIDLGYCMATVRGNLPWPPEHKTVLCIGTCESGETMAQAKAFKERNECSVAVCNAAAEVYTGAVDFLVSSHTSKLPGWLAGRKYKKTKPLIVGSKPVEGVDLSIAADRAIGGSAMLMVMAAKAMGYERIVLVGVSLHDPYLAPLRPLWKDAKSKGLLNGVESLSGGWVAQLLAGRAK